MDPTTQEQQSGAVTVPAPVGGWNAKDSYIDMPETDAIRLENFFPGTNSVKLRNGFTEHSDTTEVGHVVETMMEYLSEAGTRKLFAVVNEKVYNVTTSTPSEETLDDAIAGGSQLSWINFNNKLIICNGVDKPEYYNGSAWTDCDFTTIADDSVLIHVNSYKQRLYLVEKDSQSIWYGGTSAIAGAVVELDLTDVFQLGGPILYTLTWSYDSGEGIKEMLVIVSEAGEVLIYNGSYPGDATTWNKIAQFVIPPPLGRRSYVHFGSDILIATLEGVISVSSVLSGGETTSYATISDKINDKILEAASKYSSNFGWSTAVYPRGKYLVLNIPTAVTGVVTDITTDQYVMNTITGAWCKFTGQHAGDWIVSGDALYFGGKDGIVYKADDDTDDNGTPIPIKVKTAFSFCSDRQSSKRFTLAKPLIYGYPNVEFVFEIDVDFDDSASTDTITISDDSGVYWDTILWDTSEWGAAQTVINEWYTINGYGKAVSCKIEGSFSGVEFELSGINISYETGGIL